MFKTNLIYFPHSFSFNLPFKKLSCWTVNKFAYWSDALNIICLPCTIKIIKSLCILSETFMFAGLKYCKFSWWNHILNGRKNIRCKQPHQIPRNTSSRSDERGDEFHWNQIKMFFIYISHLKTLAPRKLTSSFLIIHLHLFFSRSCLNIK